MYVFQNRLCPMRTLRDTTVDFKRSLVEKSADLGLDLNVQVQGGGGRLPG